MFRVYFITDRHLMKRRYMQIVREAAKGGAEMIQVREKDLADGELLELTRRVVRAARPYRRKVLVNGRFDVARLAGASGVHLGKSTVPVEAVRRAMGKKFLIGYSAHSLREAREAERRGADFVTYSPVFPTRAPWKGRPKGTAQLRRVAAALRIPVYALGGVSSANVARLEGTGVRGVAAVSAIACARSPREAVRALQN